MSFAGAGKKSMREARHYSLATLLALVTFVTLAPVILSGAFMTYQWEKQRRAEEVGRLAEYSAVMARATDRELRGHLETAEAVSLSRNLAAGNYREFWVLASDVARRAGGHFVLIDRDG
jgi:hypothetical protein